jgi:hypothetical protein
VSGTMRKHGHTHAVSCHTCLDSRIYVNQLAHRSEKVRKLFGGHPCVVILVKLEEQFAELGLGRVDAPADDLNFIESEDLEEFSEIDRVALVHIVLVGRPMGVSRKGWLPTRGCSHCLKIEHGICSCACARPHSPSQVQTEPHTEPHGGTPCTRPRLFTSPLTK